jgi:prolyl oligopeptidase
MNDPSTFPPAARMDLVVDVLHGVSVCDPYRWLEDQFSSETRHWLDAQTRYARSYLDGLPTRGRIKRRVEELLSVQVILQIWQISGKYLLLKREPDQEQPVIVLHGRSSDDSVLVDPAARGEGAAVSVRILGVSSRRSVFAYSVKNGGEDSSTVEFFDLTTNQALPDRFPQAVYRGIAFSADGTGVYYAHESSRTYPQRRRGVYWHRFGTPYEADNELFTTDDDPKQYIHLVASKNGRYLGYLIRYMDDYISTRFYLHDVVSDTPPRQIFERENVRFWPQFSGDQILATTNWKAPNFNVVGLDLRDLSTPWRVIVGESDACLQTFRATRNHILVSYSEGPENRIRLFDLRGRPLRSIDLPCAGTVRFLTHEQEMDEIYYEFSSFAHPPEIFCFSSKTELHHRWYQQRSLTDSSSIVIEKVHYPSSQSVEVPLLLVSPRPTHRANHLPIVLTAYGGFGSTMTPQYSVFASVLVEMGCSYGVACVRGGSELGAEWHAAGMKHNRQNTIDDFIAAAEWLTNEHLASPGRLAIAGGSNGGLLVAAALMQRPDLFRAVLCIGPMLDMLRYHRFDAANRYVREYGSAEDSAAFEYLRAYSPYHNVCDGIPYPAVLFVSGDLDMRCNPMHTRKMTARLQAASSSDHPILLDYGRTWGHTPTQPLTRRIEALTDRLAFLCNEIGVRP